MAASLNALGLIFVIGLTTYLLVRWGSWKTETGRTVVACFSGIALIFLTSCFFVSFSGIPLITQCIIPGICLTLILMFIPYEVKAQLYGSLIVIFFCFLLCYQFDFISASGYYTGPFGSSRHNRSSMKSNLRAAKYYLQRTSNNKQYIPAGWFSDIAVKKLLPKELVTNFKETRYSPIEAYPLWHSWLTGIFGKRHNEQLELWYPGGTIPEALDKIEFRKRD